MELTAQIHQFIENPFPLWEPTLTHQLVQHKWSALKSQGFLEINSYSTARIWLNNPFSALDKKKCVPGNSLFVEMPSLQMQSFYDEHGLKLLSENEIETGATVPKLGKALSSLQLIQPVYDCVADLVRAIHILRQPDAEIDLSYSHPQIPFSIFLSVCEDDSTLSSFRVAESILHEAMHLKLTLIENVVPLIKPDTTSLYYSPWRDEERPVIGVLHGLFVFRAIEEFYIELCRANELLVAKDYLSGRINQIKDQIDLLKDFPVSLSLTEAGASLVTNLSPWN